MDDQEVRSYHQIENVRRKRTRLKDYGSAQECFDENVITEPNSGCWIWLGKLDPRQGYPTTVLVQGKQWSRVSRLALDYVGRPARLGMMACHTCDVPACVNPDHLFEGTQLDNMRDFSAKGRHLINRTHCKHGHSLSDDVLWSEGRRFCRICRRTRQKAWYQKRKVPA